MTDRAEDNTPDTGHASRKGTAMSALEAAAELGLSERTIRRAIARDELAALKRGGVYRIDPEDLAHFAMSRAAPISLATRRHEPTRLVSLSRHPQTQPFEVPRPLTPLLGRARELGNLRERLLDDEVQLVTLTGPGGVGKTRLAIEAATTLRDAFGDGVWFVDLLPHTDPARVSGAIAEALGILDTAGRSLTERLKSFLEKCEALLILDNFERVADAAPLLVPLLGSCRKLKVLVTSRVSLHVSGERQFPVPPLECPASTPTLTLAEANGSGAVRLFAMRAEAARPEFELTEANVAAVAAICQRLDGLPLAIELAAARAKHLNPSVILARLNRRLELLKGGMQDQPSRMRSMRDTVAWSYDLLTPDEQRLFRRLSVFVGGFSLDAAVAVCAGEQPGAGNQRWLPDGDPACAPPDLPTSVLDGVTSLIDKSLLEQAREPVDEPRFTMLDTLREYGLEQLEASGERDIIQERHAASCLALVESVEAERIGLTPPTGGNRLGPDRENVRAAVQWLSDRGEVNMGLRLASALWPLWLERGELTEGHVVLATLLAAPGASADKAIRAKATCVTGALAQALGDHDQASALSRQARLAFQQLGDIRGEAFALNTLALDAMSQGNYAESERFLQGSLERFRAVCDPRAGGWAMRHLSSLAYSQGDVGRAAALAEEGLALAQQTASRIDIARLSLNVSLMAGTRLDLDRAQAASQEALVLFREEGDRWGEAYALLRLGRVALERGELDQAAASIEASLTLLRAVGDAEGTAVVLVHLGWAKRAQGSQVAAARHFAGGLARARERRHPSCMASALLGVGAIALDRGDLHAAGAAWTEALRIATGLEDQMLIATALEWSSHLATSRLARTTAHVLGAASALRDRFGFPRGRQFFVEHAPIVLGLRSHLGETSYDAAIEEGGRLPLDEAIALSADLLGSMAPAAVAPILSLSPKAGLDPDRYLTPREVEVLRLLVEGHSNAEIADVLYVGVRTARAHVASILTKLGVSTRTAAATYAIRHDLI